MNHLSTFTHALVRPPTANMADGLTTQNLGAPDFENALAQHHAYCDALVALGLTVHTLPPDDRYPDGCFVEDTAIIHGSLIVITQPGAESRRGEPEAIAQWFAAARPDWTVVTMQGAERLDGGDVLFCADEFGGTRVLIGVGKRTNSAGAERLSRTLREADSNLRVDSVYFDGMLHLKSGLNELTPGVLLLAPELTLDYSLDFAKVYTLPADESYAANVVPINGVPVIPAGYHTVREIAANHCSRVVELEMSEFAKMDGGLTCLSLRY